MEPGGQISQLISHDAACSDLIHYIRLTLRVCLLDRNEIAQMHRDEPAVSLLINFHFGDLFIISYSLTNSLRLLGEMRFERV